MCCDFDPSVNVSIVSDLADMKPGRCIYLILTSRVAAEQRLPSLAE